MNAPTNAREGKAMNTTNDGDRFGYVGNLIDPDWTPGSDHAAPPISLPRHEGQPHFPAPGIYFGVPEEVYHAIPAGSSSGLKRLSTSSMDFWADSWMNLDRVARESRWFDYGKAIHAFVLEGEDAYLSRYAVELDKSEHEGALENVAQIKEAIAKLGEKPTSKGFDDVTRPAKKEDWIAQLLHLDPEAVIWDVIEDEFKAKHEGKALISSQADRRIRIAAHMIAAHDGIAALFRDGYAEVSVFWHCPLTGAPMKARFDYLKLRQIVDLKSFSNKNGKPIDRAIETTIANYRYNVPQVVYDEALEAAKAMLLASGPDAVFIAPGHSNDEAQAIRRFCEELAEQPPADFLLVFQQSGGAPVTRAVKMPRETMGVFGTTQRRIEELKRSFVANCEVYGVDPWFDIQPITDLPDENIPMWATEI